MPCDIGFCAAINPPDSTQAWFDPSTPSKTNKTNTQQSFCATQSQKSLSLIELPSTHLILHHYFNPNPTLHTNEIKIESAIVVGVNTPKQTVPIDESLAELEQLVFTSGAISKKRFIQNLEHPQPKTYVGKGKLEEIKQYVLKNNIDLVIFDDELTPAQVRNIETEIENTKILSRTHLILDIFATNAKTAQAKTQV